MLMILLSPGHPNQRSWVSFLTTRIVFTGIFSSPWKWRGTATSLFLTKTSTGVWMAPSATRSTENLPTQTSAWILDQITILPTYKLFLQPWCNVWLGKPPWWVGSSSRPLSGKTSTLANRYDVPSTWWWEPQSPNRRPPHSLSCLMSKQNTAALEDLQLPPSREGWPETDDSRGIQHPCKCGQVYTGLSSRSIETRIKERNQHIRLGHPHKLAVAEHSFNHDHLINFQDTWILSTISDSTDRLKREATVLEIHPNNMNREDGLALRGSCKPLIRLLTESRHPPK